MDVNFNEDKIWILYFVFGETLYGIDSEKIKEIVELPYIKSSINTPTFFKGSIEYRGEMVPVIDMRTCLGMEYTKYQPSDVLVVIEEDSLILGLIFPPILDILGFSITQKLPTFPQFIKGHTSDKPIVDTYIKSHDNTIYLINTTAVIELLNNLKQQQMEGSEIQENLKTPLFDKEIEEKDRELYVERAKRVASVIIPPSYQQDLFSLLLIKEEKDFFFIHATVVKELCDLSEYSKIPTGHRLLVGFMNLRGDILPLTDFQNISGRPKKTYSPTSKVLIFQNEDVQIGIIIDEVIKEVTVEKSLFCELPEIDENLHLHSFIKEAINFENKVVGIISHEKILHSFFATN